MPSTILSAVRSARSGTGRRSGKPRQHQDPANQAVVHGKAVNSKRESAPADLVSFQAKQDRKPSVHGEALTGFTGFTRFRGWTGMKAYLLNRFCLKILPVLFTCQLMSFLISGQSSRPRKLDQEKQRGREREPAPVYDKSKQEEKT